ncbi:MAG: hypothetical protein JXA42_20095 [Anaerolineales bacterium]|nr:hypothetical protein [Anaerolineales bacterium]
MESKWINNWGKPLNFPDDVYYSPELMWVRNGSDGSMRVGISDMGVKAVKKLIYVRIKSKKGDRLNKGDLIGMVETSKMVWEIKSPISGVVIDVNKKVLRGDPSPLFKDAYGEGWIVDLEKTSENEAELEQLYKGGEESTNRWITERVEAVVPLQQG